MPGIVYENFDLLIQRIEGEKCYRAKVLKSEGGGDANGEPFSLADLRPTPSATSQRDAAAVATRDIFLDDETDGDTPQGSRPDSFEAAKELGTRLFRAAFQGDIYLALRRSIDRARARKAKLRIRLNLTDFPELAVLPWEYLCDPKFNHFYAQFIETPIVRYLEQSEPAGELPVAEKLRVLVVTANPGGTAHLDVEKELKNLREAVRPLEEQNLITLDVLPNATTEALIDKLEGALQGDPYHIFHFIGHGIFDPQSNQGAVLFHEGQRGSRPVSGEYLGNLLSDNNTLRLAVLNTCQGGSISETNSYAGIAQSLLIYARIPAVVAMQYEITDEAAINFSQKFYGALAKYLPIEVALTQARKAILDRNKIEWATPVLYMRSDDGRLFENQGEPSDALAPAPAATNAADALMLPQLDAHYQTILNSLLDGRLVFFLGMDVHLYGRKPLDPWDIGQPPPCSSELVSYLARRFNYPLNKQMDLASISQYVAVKTRGGLGLLYDTLSNVFPEDQTPTRLHYFLAELPPLVQQLARFSQLDPIRQRFVVVTTSYDNLLEKAFQEKLPAHHVVSYVAEGDSRGKFMHTKFVGRTRAERPAMIDVAQEYLGLANQEPVIVKLPGVVDRYDAKFAITEDHFFDYLAHKSLSDLLPPQLIGKLKASSHLFLGYSLREWNLRALLYRIWEDQKPRYESWAVHPRPEDVDEKFWLACHVESVVAELKEYVEGLEQRVKRLPAQK